MKGNRAVLIGVSKSSDPVFRLTLALLNWNLEYASCSGIPIDRLKANYFSALICEYHLGETNGLSLICSMRVSGIWAPAILIVEDSKMVKLVPKELLGICAVLCRPFTAKDLLKALQRAQTFE